MERLITALGNLCALLGVLLCASAGLTRLAGSHYTFGFASITLYQAGIGLLVLACFCCLQRILMRME